ncbi:hypothetical protein PRK78_005290 [Emydomyces testavorans]|uniref:Uncharacterized protein n=1 Tax=Emydomyces testavorans TaxID=2070801 RepID=A0AAF0DN30_9EURO|nr:hypothetical protein PRK78_005290 [Emydomyces testavorans]
MSVLSRISYASVVIFLLLFCGLSSASRLAHSHHFSTRTYKYGQSVPVTDPSGQLQYIPFPTCNETSHSLSFRYGVSETITCTIDSLPDTLYHLFEYYVHSDAPLTCRVPTVPLHEPSTHHDPTATSEGSHDAFMDGGAATPFTPLIIALQGTLQKSHLHIWSEMNVLLHRSVEGKKKEGKKEKKAVLKGKRASGQIVAGTAYSVPWMEASASDETKNRVSGDVRVPWDPWKAGEGAKVLRGEPLRFTFHVEWMQESNVSGLVLSQGHRITLYGIIYNCLLFAMAACSGAVLMLLWEHSRRRRGGSWNGDGLLGRSASGHGGLFGRKSGGVSINLGTGGKMNGYGGYGFGGKNGVSQGYGGYSSGKRD